VEGSGCQASAVVPGAPYGTPLVIYYWPVLARAAALFRMADAASYPYIHVSNRSELAAMVSSNRVHGSGGSSDMFAPPVVKDGDFIVSQSVAATVHLGQKLGFDRGVPSLAKSLQYLNDLQDLTVEFSKAISALTGDSDDAKPLADFVTGGRLEAWLTTLESSITAPFYFGPSVSYVDFYFLQTLDWLATSAFDPLRPVAGDVFAPFAKVVALHAAMRALPSYQTTRATGPLVGSVMSEVHVARYATAHATAQRWHLIHAVEG